MDSGIYKITSPSGRVYIGQASDTSKRWKEYIKLRCKGQLKLFSSFLKYGVESHIFEVIEECSLEQLNERERYWQDYYDVLNGGLNCVLQNSEEKRKVYSEEIKEKMSKAKRGDNHPMFGKTGILCPNYGLKRSKETCDKMSRNRKSQDIPNSKKILDESTDVVYNTMKEASKALNINYNTLAGYLTGRKKNKTSLRYL